MIERHILKELLNWKEKTNRKPLIIRGARQVGKTTLIKSFSKSYQNKILLNLEKPADKRIFESFENISDIIDVLLLKFKLSPDKTKGLLIFIDEIQESTAAIKYLRYFYEEYPEIHVIAAGSLLEFALKDVENFPVGRVEYLYMHPLNFREYLNAMNHDYAIEHLSHTPVTPSAHSVLIELFKSYAIVGGMPEAVKMYVEEKKIAGLTRIYESLWETFSDDMTKYATNKTELNVMRHIVNTAYLNLDARIKFQHFGNSNYKSREVGEAMRTLENARFLFLIYPTTEVEYPITPDYKKSPRLQFLDSGLVNYKNGIQAELLTSGELSGNYSGYLIPHLVTQEIMSINSFSNTKPNFWVREKSQSSAEVDLVVPYSGKIIPIEIKSGEVGKLRSLHQFMERVNHNFAVRIYGGEFKIQKVVTPNNKKFWLMNLPYYLSIKIYDYLELLLSNDLS
ncbi:MAG: ATP-binding protein [Ignavibacteriaceae bacterium]|nr:ATP-binding protein [Ignavibacteriaceae bacterium]